MGCIIRRRKRGDFGDSAPHRAAAVLKSIGWSSRHG
jgi:hypothetical protein